MLRNKELVVLVLLLVLLLYRGYTLMNPTEAPPLTMGKMASARRTGEDPLPPSPPPPSEPIVIDGLVRANPFTTRARPQEDVRNAGPEARPPLQLVRIQQWRDGSYRAQIASKAGVRAKWYREGEQFESYRIERIDAEGESVTVYSEEHRKNFEFKI